MSTPIPRPQRSSRCRDKLDLISPPRHWALCLEIGALSSHYTHDPSVRRETQTSYLSTSTSSIHDPRQIYEPCVRVPASAPRQHRVPTSRISFHLHRRMQVPGKCHETRSQGSSNITLCPSFNLLRLSVIYIYYIYTMFRFFSESSVIYPLSRHDQTFIIFGSYFLVS